MNRIVSFDRRESLPPPREPRPRQANAAVEACLRPARRLRADAESLLRDMAFVLSLTERVKQSILNDRELSAV